MGPWPRPVSFVDRSIILCPYLGGSTIRGSTVLRECKKSFDSNFVYSKTSNK